MGTLARNGLITRLKRNRRNKENCGICTVRYDFPRYRTLLRNSDYQWIGCDFKGCDFWGHAKWVCVLIGNKKIPKC